MNDKTQLPVDVVIVNWNGAHFCEPLLDQLRELVEAGSLENVIVVDNASTDGSRDLIASKFPWVRLIASPTNSGYAGGNNLGLKEVRAPYVWLLNNDTAVIDAEVVSKLRDVLEQNSACAAVSPALVLPSGALQTGVGGFDIGLWTAFNYFFLLSRLLPGWCRGFYISQQTYVERTKPVDVDWVCGAGMMLRTDALRSVGGVPSDYFMYAEDIRLCRALRANGFVIQYVPQAKLLHIHGGTSDAQSISTKWVTSTLTEFASAGNRVSVAVMKGIFAAGFLLRAIAYSGAALIKRRSDYRRRAAAMWAYCKASFSFHAGA